MKILELISKKNIDYRSNRPPSIAFLGDSVTHSCFELYEKNGTIQTYVDQENGYPQNVRKILNMLYPDCPLTIINGGISGDRAPLGEERLNRDILSYNPDLVVVCYGLNDCQLGEEGLKDYLLALTKIFDSIKNSGAEVIFLTPNIRTSEIDDSLVGKFKEVGEYVINNECDGWLDKYISAATKLCKDENVCVCDCYSIWKKMKDKKVDINNILSNKINHPIRDLHWLFAYELVKTMLNN